MSDSLERMARRQGAMMREFLDSPEGAAWVERTETTADGTALILSSGGTSLPLRGAACVKTLLAYQKKEVLFPRGRNMARADCVDVAIKLAQAFESAPDFLAFRRSGYLIERISAGSVVGRPLPFMRELGYGFHDMNLIELPEEEGGPFYAAVDLTAHYTMGLEKGLFDIFVIMAQSPAEIFGALRAITGSKWERVFD